MTKSNRIIALILIGGFTIGTLLFSGWAIWGFLQEEDQSEETAESPDHSDHGKGTIVDFEPVSEPISELEIIDQVVGEESAQTVQSGDDVVVDYTLAFMSNGHIVQKNENVTFNLDNVIVGWKEGLVGMKVGGERRLLVPSAKAYGKKGSVSGDIPPNTDLVFDIKLISILTKDG